ncbi:hypothetical protein fugu_010570 [Takifugu bimaculatus]|uniref:Cytochrome P450 n=1 Tax=Takifugu bimaculatus TaxID=433685 RepID=A0A4Z2CAD0_9TELE|nr:hypothetical protein fugu_010570 [Takifugu bimaculatus]
MEFSVTLILAGLVLAFFWFILQKRKYNLPPGPTTLPLVGNLPQLDKKQPFKSFTELSKSYGPVMTLYLGWQRTVVLTGYEVVKEALVDQAEDFTGRGPLPFLLKATNGYGLGISNGECWRQLRRFTLSTLRDFGMGTQRDGGVDSRGEQAFDSPHKDAESQTIRPHIPARLHRVQCDLLHGVRRTLQLRLTNKFLELLHVIAEVLRFNSSFLGQMYNVFPWILEHLPGPQHTMFSHINFLREFIKKKIQEHKESLDPSSPRDYIDTFLIRMEQEKNLPNTEFHYENLVSTVLNLFLAGTETTSSTLRYALGVLIKHPNVQEEMQREIDNVVRQDQCPKMEDRKSLPFTDAVIHEVQRFLDIVPFGLPHYALKDITFRGYSIPKGTVIIPLLHSVLKGDQWETPWAFNPKHFLDQNGSFKKNPAFLPFSAGKRSCVGESLARMELFIFLVTLLKDFTFSCIEGPDSISLNPQYSGFANLPRNYEIVATPR